jgi:hypothetical protein
MKLALLAIALFQVGVGVHVGQNKNALNATADALEQGGFTSFRDEVFWHRLERKKGVLEFPDSLNDLDQLVTRSAARYGSPEDYAKVLKAAYSAVKAESPTATVIGGAFAGYDYKWLEAFGRAGGFASLDGFSTHPYVFAEGKKGTPDSVIRHLDELKALIDRLAPGRNVRVYVTEAGWPVHTGANGVTEQQQSAYLQQFLLLAKSRPWIAGVWWYDLFDDGDNATDKEHRFGLIDRAGVKRPAFQALAEKRVAP